MLKFLRTAVSLERHLNNLAKLSGARAANSSRSLCEVISSDGAGRAAFQRVVHASLPECPIKVRDEPDAGQFSPRALPPREHSAYLWCLCWSSLVRKFSYHSRSCKSRCLIAGPFPRPFLVNGKVPRIGKDYNVDLEGNIDWHTIIDAVQQSVSTTTTTTIPPVAITTAANATTTSAAKSPPRMLASPLACSVLPPPEETPLAPFTNVQPRPRATQSWTPVEKGKCLHCKCRLRDPVVLCSEPTPQHIVCRECAQTIIDSELSAPSSVSQRERPVTAHIKCRLCGSVTVVSAALGAGSLPGISTGMDTELETLKHGFDAAVPTWIAAGRGIAELENRLEQRLAEMRARTAAMEKEIDDAFADLEMAVVRALQERKTVLMNEIRAAEASAGEPLRSIGHRLQETREHVAGAVALVAALERTQDSGAAVRLSRALSKGALEIRTRMAEDTLFVAEGARTEVRLPSFSTETTDTTVRSIARAIGDFGSVVSLPPSTAQQPLPSSTQTLD